LIQRGRKGAAQFETTGAVMVVSRPGAPLDLTEAETEEWMAIVDAMPADWFARETWPLLGQYCRHIVGARRIAQLVDAEISAAEIDFRMLDKMMRSQARETMAMRALAASLRLSQQSTWNAKSADTAKAKRTVKRLWEA
jgi:hypothetical protein